MVTTEGSDIAYGTVAVAQALCPTDGRDDGAAVGYYRIYLMDHENRIRGHRLIPCAYEEDAVAEAMLLLGEYPRVEVWNGPRLVRRLALRVGRTQVVRA